MLFRKTLRVGKRRFDRCRSVVVGFRRVAVFAARRVGRRIVVVAVLLVVAVSGAFEQAAAKSGNRRENCNC